MPLDPAEKQLFENKFTWLGEKIDTGFKQVNNRQDKSDEDVRKLDKRVDGHDTEITTLKNYKEGHQTWHNDNVKTKRWNVEIWVFIALWALEKVWEKLT